MNNVSPISSKHKSSRLARAINFFRSRDGQLTVLAVAGSLTVGGVAAVTLSRPSQEDQFRDRIGVQLDRTIGNGTKFKADLSYDGRNSPDIVKRRVGVATTPNGDKCEIIFELGLQPDMSVKANVIDVEECAGSNSSSLEIKVNRPFVEPNRFQTGICDANRSTDQLADDIREEVKGFAGILKFDSKPSTDCAGLQSAVRPVIVKRNGADQCEVWARIDAQGISLERNLTCVK